MAHAISKAFKAAEKYTSRPEIKKAFEEYEKLRSAASLDPAIIEAVKKWQEENKTRYLEFEEKFLSHDSVNDNKNSPNKIELWRARFFYDMRQRLSDLYVMEEINDD